MPEGNEVNLSVVSERMSGQGKKEVRVATWNFSGLCSESKQREVGELLQRLKIDVVAGRESWEREGEAVAVDGNRCAQQSESGVWNALCQNR